ncbi:RNA polymerase sporulation sigma factor SigF [Faecalicatena contorta]|uniref:RNA polymerase sporulation sigma factor SigF n=1 Tax=Faecalicatena contorta TaxID=39482 RepID=UPI001F261BB1|nr:RNA polymerase sporulation sigma factor SigF [Faecalicatena contorta]MCF2681631.1 RNA polymerase sporulation sigma factor SigF [Faecalicatena contorta]
MDHTLALIQRSHNGDEEARAQLVEENTGLVWCIVKRYYNRGAEADDLFQIGSIGLLKAIDKFDLSYDVKFSTYAVPMISGEIKRFLRDDGMIKVSRSLKELAYRAYGCEAVMQEKLGRDPTVTELAEELGVETEELTMALEASGDIESLHKPIYQKEGQEIRLMDKLPQKKEEEDKILDHMLLKQLLSYLDKEERQLIYLRYFADQTQSQVGKQMGISQVQVSRMEKKILKNLRKMV